LSDSIIDQLLAWTIAAWLALFSWLGKRQVDRIDALEKTTVQKDDFKDLRDTVTQHNDRSKSFQDKTYAALAENSKNTAVIIQMLKDRDKE